MKKITEYLGKGLTGLFVLGLLAWAANLTILAVRAAIPDQPLTPYLALVLFDGGALAWMQIFLKQSKGTPQRAAAILLTVLDLAGVIAMSAGGLHLIASNAISKILLWATLTNVSAWYWYKLSSPDNLEAIQAQNLEDELTEEAQRQAKMNIEREAVKLGAVLATRTTSRIKYRMRLPMTAQEAAEWQGEAIEGEVTETTPALPQPRQPHFSFMDTFRAFFGLGMKPLQPEPYSEPITTSQNLETNSNESDPPA